jgi:hypothetical protein
MHESGRGYENRCHERTTVVMSQEEGVHDEGIRAKTV